MRKLVLTLLVSGLCACSANPAHTGEETPVAETTPVQTTPVQTTPQDEEPAPEPEVSAASSSTTTEEMPAADTAAGVAARIAQAHGVGAYDDAAELQFEFAVLNAGTEVMRAKHRWDRNADRDRVEWTKDGKTVVAVVDLAEPANGWVTVDGALAAEPDRTTHLKEAHARWVNDLYWLAMPVKLRDQGVNLELLPDAKVNDRPHRVLKVTFGEVGLTPGDTYWVYADAETFVVSKWEMLLEGAKDGAKPTAVTWESPQQVGGVTFHRDHKVVGTPRNIVTVLKSVSAEVDAASYEAPEP